jgi:hypothetical protein
MPARRDGIERGLDGLPVRTRIGGVNARARGRRGGASIAACWAAAGLLLVAGFWAYLGALELAGGAISRLLPQSETVGARGPGCTVLTLDRPSGRTTAGPCPGAAPVVRNALTAHLGAREPR